MNQGIFSGNIGNDADLRTTNGGEKVVNFSLAVNIGNKQEKKTMWVACSLWGTRAEALAQYLKKGVKATVSGKVVGEEYTTKDGSRGFRLSLKVNEVDLHGAPKRDDESQPSSNANRRADYDDTDMPF